MQPEQVPMASISALQDQLEANRQIFRDQLAAHRDRLRDQLAENISNDRLQRLNNASGAVDRLTRLDTYRRYTPDQWENLPASADKTFRDLQGQERADRQTLNTYLTAEVTRNGLQADRHSQVIVANQQAIDTHYQTMANAPTRDVYDQALTNWQAAKDNPAVNTAETARETARQWQNYCQSTSDNLAAIRRDERSLGAIFEHHGNLLMDAGKTALPWSANQIRAIKESGGQSIELLGEYVRGQGLENRGRTMREYMGINAALAEKYRTGNCGENAQWMATEAEFRLSGANIPTTIVSHSADHAFFILGKRNYPEAKTLDTWPPDEKKPQDRRYNLATVHRQEAFYSGKTDAPVNYKRYAQDNYLHGAKEAPARWQPFKRTKDALDWVKKEHPGWREHVYNITRAVSRQGNVSSSDSGVTINTDRLQNPMSTPGYTTSTASYPSDSGSNFNPVNLNFRSLSVSEGSSPSPPRSYPANPVPTAMATMTSPGSGSEADRSRNGSSPSSSSSDDGRRSRRSDAPSPDSMSSGSRRRGRR